MNPKIFRQQNPNKKRLLLTKSSKESIEEYLQPPHKKSGCLHSHAHQKQHRHQTKKSQGSRLPLIADLANSRISISLPPDCTRTRRTSSSTAKFLSGCKTKQSSFFSLLKPKGLKIQPLLSNFTTELLSRQMLHMHFGNYLIQPKTFPRILLFAINSLNNSRNMPNFQRVLMDHDKYQEMIDKVEKGSFSFEFGVRNNHKMGLNFQTVDEKVESQSLLRLAMEAEGRVLASRNEQLHWEIKEKRKDLENIQNRIQKCRIQINNLTLQIRRLNNQIMRQNQTLYSLKNSIMESNKIIEQLQANKKRFSSFMINFHHNKCNQVTVDTRRLEQNMHEYADYLNFHPLGRRPYEKPKFATDLQRMLMNEQQQFCRFIGTETLSPEGRLKPTQNFFTKTREEYNSIINELLIVIREKTEFIGKFTGLMEEWQENNTRRREVLKEINSILQAQALSLEEVKGYRDQGEGEVGQNPYAEMGNSEKETKIITIAERTIAIYKIVASFV